MIKQVPSKLKHIEITRAESDDLLGILELYKQLNPADPDLSLDKAQSIWHGIQQNSNLLYFVAKASSQIVGTCNISIIPNLTRAGRSFGLIENVIVHSKFRRQRIGENLLRMAINAAKEQDCYKVILLSSKSRTESHAFYEAIGFNGNAKQGYEIRIELTECLQ
jgi:ribosomal protein S18 acetylase RimI-like enzyme